MNMHDDFSAVAKAALECAARGWHVFPGRIKDGSKRSFVAGKANGGARWGATTDADTIRDYWQKFPNAFLGIATGPDSGFFVIDADTLEGHDKDGVGALREWIKEHGDLPDTIEAITPSGGWHIYFKWPVDLKILNSESKLAPGIDVRGEGGMVFAPSTIKTGTDKSYRWKNPPGFFELADCPEWLLEKIRENQKPKLSERAMPEGFKVDTSGSAFASAISTSAEEVTDLLSYIDPDAGGYGQWLSVLMALHDWSDGSSKGLSIAEEWSALGGKYKPSEVAEKWKGFEVGGGTNWATVPAIARANGADLRALRRKHKVSTRTVTAGQLSVSEADRARGFEELLEAAKALESEQVEEMEAIIAECAPLNPMRADAVFREIKKATGVTLTTLRDQLSKSVEPCSDPDHLELARLVIEHIGRENLICTDAFVWRWQNRGVWTQQDDRAIKQMVQGRLDCEEVPVTATRVSGVTDVFKSEIYRPNHEFNLGNPETVNCPNGELTLDDLGSWQRVPHRRENYRTTQIPVAYDPSADAPMFKNFLGQVFRDDPDRNDKIKSVLELIGYTLMSHARHERFVMLIGPGANGKSVLLAVLEGLLGPKNVAGVQPANFDRSFQRAHLHQKLANIVTELKQGEVIADAELKAITSGEPATVEHKFKNPFVMRPFSTCWFGTNHMPHTRDFSEALFRRATILQFNRTFAKSEQDPRLKENLLTELPGILNLALDAYAEAVTNGFTEPASSEHAKNEWRLEADQVALFVEEKCQRDPNARETIQDLYANYRLWASNSGISKTMGKNGFIDRLIRLGFARAKSGAHRYVTGLKLEA